MKHLRRRRAAGFSLVETVMSVVLVAVMFAAVMQAVGASRMLQYKTGGERRGSLLARQLLAEILQRSYEDPEGPSGTLGLDAGEVAVNRLDFDDVDDYDGWFASPPRDRESTSTTEQVGWSREAAVSWVNPADLAQISVVETKTKRVVVTVKHNGMTMAQLTAVRTDALSHVDR